MATKTSTDPEKDQEVEEILVDDKSSQVETASQCTCVQSKTGCTGHCNPCQCQGKAGACG